MKVFGFNVENRYGFNFYNRGDRILAMGSNRDLVYGFVRGGSVWLTVVNLL